MKQVVYIPAEAPSYEELEERNLKLSGSLKEARRGQRVAEKWAMMLVALLAVSTTLLALTWSGVIVI